MSVRDFKRDFEAFHFVADCTKLLSSINLEDIKSSAKDLEAIYYPFTVPTFSNDPFVVSKYIPRKTYREKCDGRADNRRKRKYADWYAKEYRTRYPACKDSLRSYHEYRIRLEHAENKKRIVLDTIRELHGSFCGEDDDGSYSPTRASEENE